MLTFAFRPGSVIIFFILYFKSAVTTEKGIENLRVAISANNTFGDLQAKDLVLQSEDSTKSTTTTGIKRLGIPSINVRAYTFLLALILLLFVSFAVSCL